LWVLEGEPQAVVQSGVLAPDQFRSRTLQDFGVAHTDVSDVVLCRNFNQLMQIRGVS